MFALRRVGFRFPVSSVQFARMCQTKANAPDGEAYVPFGSENVRKEDKAERVNEVFTDVARKYDLMNDLMSFGIHRCWKNHFVESRLTPSPKQRFLDIGGGTGDIAMRIAEFMRSQTTVVEGGVTVLDPAEPMMAIGRDRAETAGLAGAIDWVEGVGEKLPLSDAEYDAVTMAFSIRNCTDPGKVIEQSHRVLRPGGRIFILEFFNVDLFPVSLAYDFYLDMLPVIGFSVTGNWPAYQYLADSIRRFNTQDELMGKMRKAGFVGVECEKMPPFGVACILSGKKPAELNEPKRGDM